MPTPAEASAAAAAWAQQKQEKLEAARRLREMHKTTGGGENGPVKISGRYAVDSDMGSFESVFPPKSAALANLKARRQASRQPQQPVEDQRWSGSGDGDDGYYAPPPPPPPSSRPTPPSRNRSLLPSSSAQHGGAPPPATGSHRGASARGNGGGGSVRGYQPSDEWDYEFGPAAAAARRGGAGASSSSSSASSGAPRGSSAHRTAGGSAYPPSSVTATSSSSYRRSEPQRAPPPPQQQHHYQPPPQQPQQFRQPASAPPTRQPLVSLDDMPVGKGSNGGGMAGFGSPYPDEGGGAGGKSGYGGYNGAYGEYESPASSYGHHTPSPQPQPRRPAAAPQRAEPAPSSRHQQPPRQQQQQPQWQDDYSQPPPPAQPRRPAASQNQNPSSGSHRGGGAPPRPAPQPSAPPPRPPPSTSNTNSGGGASVDDLPAVARGGGYMAALQAMEAEYPLEEEQPAYDGPLVPCRTCNRSFAPNALEKHSRICVKVFQRKRKVFDSTKARLEGTEAAAVLNKQGGKPGTAGGRAGGGGGGGGRGEQPLKAVPKWKAQSEAFRAQLRAAAQYTQAVASGGPLPPPAPTIDDPSYVQCPHCGRKFNETAGARHIPRCQDIQAKPTRLKAGAGHGSYSTAAQPVQRGGAMGTSRVSTSSAAAAAPSTARRRY